MMKSKFFSCKWVVVFVVLWGGWAGADEVWLKNGDHITGKVVSLEGGTMLFSTSYAGDLAIRWEEVVNLKTEEPVKVVLGHDTAIHGQVLPGEKGKIMVDDASLAGPVTMNLSDMRLINPEPTMRITLRANLGASFAMGNTEKEDIYTDIEFVSRTTQNRYTIGGLYRSAESEGMKTEEKTLGFMKYDHFFSEKWYGYANTSAEKDKFKDLDLRYNLGLGAGYQFIESKPTNLSFEGGLSYVYENYIVAEAAGFLAGRWAMRFDHFLLPDVIQYFLYHTGLQSLDHSQDLVLFTQTGFRIPFFKNLNFTGQLNWDYDKSPAEGARENDYTYIFTIGYQMDK
jgi:hypothetical protein